MLPLRIVAGLGDAARERSLLSALTSGGEIVLVERCLSADQLLASVAGGQLDAVLIADGLHRLTDRRLQELSRTGVPLVLLAVDPDDARWDSFSGAILPLEANVETVRRSLVAAVRGERPHRAQRPDESQAQVAAAPNTRGASPVGVTFLAVTSGPGSPGRTTIALNLAAALGAVAPTVLVDADLTGPSVAAHLDLDPTRNLSMLGHAEPQTPQEWDRALAQEIQPLTAHSRQGFVLCGIPKPEMRRGISPRFFERLLAELQGRYRYVILDLGHDLLGAEADVQRLALTLAQRVLLVASADLVGLWRARTALALLHTHLQLGPENVALIVNRHDLRHGHSRSEIEWALQLPVAALVPYDHRAVQRALAGQRPLVADTRSRAARSLLDLAARVHGGNIELPEEGHAHDRKVRPGRVPRVPWRRPIVAKTPDGV